MNAAHALGQFLRKLPHSAAAIIDPAKDTVVKPLDLGGAPEPAIPDGKGIIYDHIADTNEVVVIDTHSLTIKSRWKLAPGGEPGAIALDRENGRLSSSGRGPALLVMMDADSGKVIQSFPISEGVDSSDFDPTPTRCCARKIHVFHEDSADKLSALGPIETEYGAKTMAINPKTHNLFLSTSDSGPAAGPKARRLAISGTAHLLLYRK